MENYHGTCEKHPTEKHYYDYIIMRRSTKDRALILATLGLGMDYEIVIVKTPKGKVLYRKG